jgi:hypothetical protein
VIAKVLVGTAQSAYRVANVTVKHECYREPGGHGNMFLPTSTTSSVGSTTTTRNLYKNSIFLGRSRRHNTRSQAKSFSNRLIHLDPIGFYIKDKKKKDRRLRTSLLIRARNFRKKCFYPEPFHCYCTLCVGAPVSSVVVMAL